MEILFAIIISGVAFFLLFLNFQKVSKKAEVGQIEYQNTEKIASEKIKKFANIIEKEIKELIEEIENGKIKGKEALKELEYIHSRLEVFNTYYLNNKTPKELEERLAEILNDFDDILEKKVENGEELAKRYREKFRKIYKEME